MTIGLRCSSACFYLKIKCTVSQKYEKLPQQVCRRVLSCCPSPLRKIKKISIFSKIGQFEQLLWLHIGFIHYNSLSQVLASQLLKNFLFDMHTLWVPVQMKRTVCCNTPCRSLGYIRFYFIRCQNFLETFLLDTDFNISLKWNCKKEMKKNVT